MPKKSTGQRGNSEGIRLAATKRRSSRLLQPAPSFFEKLGYVRKDPSCHQNEQIFTQTAITADDRQLLTAVTRGDFPLVRRLLAKVSPAPTASCSSQTDTSTAATPTTTTTTTANVNCTDALGRSPLRIAIENENLAIVELLLTNEKIEVGDALLHAVQNESIGSVLLLINHTNRRHKTGKGMISSHHSTAFGPDMTPIILAAIKDNYAIIQLLLENGFTIASPHDVGCRCEHCRGRNAFGTSRSRLNIYSALASPSLICLTSRDPFLTAFQLSRQLLVLSRREVEFHEAYKKLAEQCRQFAVELLDQVRDSRELLAVLSYESELNYFQERRQLVAEMMAKNQLPEPIPANNNVNLARVKMALKFNQKKFIAHPSCQQLLSSMWYSAIPGFRQMQTVTQFAVVVAIGLVLPWLCFANVLLPQSKVGRLMRQPFIKFAGHTMSYIFFLVLLMTASQRFDVGTFKVVDQSSVRGAKMTSTEVLIAIFVAGHVLLDVKALWQLGLDDYVDNRWHLLTFAMNNLFVGYFSLRLLTIWSPEANDASVARSKWSTFDPNLVAECILAIASVLAWLRLISLFTISSIIGPLQVAFGRMIVDIAKFAFYYAVLMLAFSCALSQIYWFYARYFDTINANKANLTGTNSSNSSILNFTFEDDSDGRKVAYSQLFKSLFDILQSLYWGLFSLVNLYRLDIMTLSHQANAFVAKLLFGCYTFMAVMVLVKSVIAMMTESYKKTQRQSDVDWKFALAKFWLSYFEDIYELPVPFNLLPSVCCFRNLWQSLNEFRLFIAMILKKKKKKKEIKFQSSSVENVFADERVDYGGDEDAIVEEIVSRRRKRTTRYEQVARELVKRYLVKRQENQAVAGVTEYDVVEVKQGIWSFKYELLEILRVNNMKLPDYLQHDQRDASSSSMSPSSASVAATAGTLALATSRFHLKRTASLARLVMKDAARISNNKRHHSEIVSGQSGASAKFHQQFELRRRSASVFSEDNDSSNRTTTVADPSCCSTSVSAIGSSETIF